MEISDDGQGLPPGFDWHTSRSLGLSIVNTLVAEMEGSFPAWAASQQGPEPRPLWRFRSDAPAPLAVMFDRLPMSSSELTERLN